MSRVDFDAVTTAAYRELIAHRVRALPLDVFSIRFPGILCLSFQRYGMHARMDIRRLMQSQDLQDGFACREIRPGVKLILYDEDMPWDRARFTCLHEVGHLRLSHLRHGPREEVEAHFFAGQMLMPNAVLRALHLRGQALTPAFLMEVFGVSRQAAEKKLCYLERYPLAHENAHDGPVLSLLGPWLDQRYPDPMGRTSHLPPDPALLERLLGQVYGPPE